MNRGASQWPQIVALLMMLAALAAVIFFKVQCARAVGGYFETLDEPAKSR